ncbi:MAG: TetR/AcrR family transcriptional regulator [Acidimicrobiales bacterium]
MAASTTSPRRGRPRSAEADTAILAATLELAGEVGIGGMSMDELACRAGVSKATIYRRWANKEALVLDALATAMSPFDDVDTGNLRDDLVIYVTELARRKKGGKMANILPHLIEASSHDPALADSLDAYVQHRRRPLRQIFERAVERGELAADADIEVLIDVTIGPFVYRHLLTREPLDADFVRRLLAVIVPSPPA